MKKLIEKYLLNKELYILFTAFLMIISCVSFTRNFSLSFLYVFVFWGFTIFIFDIITNKISKEIILFLLFIITHVFLLFVFNNINVFENIKSIIWLTYFMIICFNIGYHLRSLNNLHKLVIFLFSFLNLIALVTYIFSFTHTKNYLVGFVDGRLWGFYFDPNYGACINVIVLFLSIYYLVCKKQMVYLLSSLLSIFYIVFSSSRGGLLSLILVAFIYLLLSLKKDKNNICMAFKVISFIVLNSILILNICPLLSQTVTQLVDINTMNKNEVVIYSDENSLNTDTNQIVIDSNKSVEEKKDHFSHENTSNVTDSSQQIIDENGASSNSINERTDKVESLNIRFNLIKEALRLSLRYPLTGIGDRNIKAISSLQADVYPLLASGKSIHNSYLTLLVSTGYILTFYLLGVIAYFILKSIITYFKTNNSFLLINILVLCASLFAALTLTEVFFAQTFITLLFWITFGFCVSKINNSKKIEEGNLVNELFS